MKFLKQARPALPFLAILLLFAVVATVSHFSAPAQSGGLASAIEKSLKE